MKQIQIPEELFMQLIKYHLLDMQELQPKIKEGLESKLDSISMRLLHSKYKTAITEEEKQKPDRNIWIDVEYQIVFAGKFLSIINRSVSRSCDSR